MKIIVILAPGFEEMEAISAIDILRRAQLDVTTVSLLPNQTVLGSHDIPVIADMSLDDVLQKEPHAWCDALILPGGMRGVENMLSDTRLIDLVKALYDAQKVVAAVCAAPLVLDKAGILQGHAFTCHPCIFDRIRTDGRREVAAITDRNIVTGRSAGCAMIWAMELTKTLVGSDDAIRGGLAIIQDPRYS